MIVPGSVNPLLMSGGDPLDELGKIDRSLRFRSAASANISKTFGAASNRQTWTMSLWFKRGTFASSQVILEANAGAPATDNTWLQFDSSDRLDFVQQTGNVQVGKKTTNRVFRDPSAHIHVVINFDSTNATASDRMRVYINGSRETSFASSTDISQNALSYANSNCAHFLAQATGTGLGNFDGYVSHAAFVDGQALAPTSFGQFHPLTGQWRPKSRSAIKAVVDAGGANSFFLPFDDPTNATTLCTDASAKGNNWTATNISLTAGVTYDSMLDTPTANFPTIDPNFAAYGFIAGTISDGGLKFASSSTYHFTPCTIPLPSYGKWYAEFIPQDTVSIIGVADLDNGSGASQNIGGGYGWYGNVLYTGNAVAAQSGLATMAANDIIGVAVDMTVPQMQIYKNGTLVVTQALTAGKRYAFACGDYYAPGGTSCCANFGQRTLSYKPAGYLALCAKNLAFPKVAKASAAFAAVTDTGANIVSTLAAAESWSSYIRIIKRRDAAEGWRWIFSDDPTYYLDSSAAAAKAAIPAFSGSSYVGYSLKVSAANGVATGRLVHTNGVADNVTDSLGNTRKAVILVNEAGSNWYLYHPDLTAGNLLYLNSTAAQTADTTINSVTGSGFTVAAALASGTYRWIALADFDGFLRIGKHIGNASADGVIDYKGFLPAFELTKPPGNASTSWFVLDSKHENSNVETSVLFANTTAGDTTGYLRDSIANGRKWRWGGGDPNSAGVNNISISFAASPFRYANAR